MSLEAEERGREAARIDRAIAAYKTAATQVRLGDSKDKVLGILQPTQFSLLSHEVKGPEATPTQTADGRASMLEVFYFRSARYADEQPTEREGQVPADDFTPYIFTDDVLTGIGWTTLLSLKVAPPPADRPKEQKSCLATGLLAGCL